MATGEAAHADVDAALGAGLMAEFEVGVPFR
jgi:hypothetical protein